MSAEPIWRRYKRWWGPDVESDVDEEFEFHIGLIADRLEASGLGREEADRRARVEFGDAARARRMCGEIGKQRLERTRRSERVARWTQDLRYASRALAKRPAFTAAVVATLALGIGANVTIFSLFNAVLLRPLPGVSEPESLVQLGRTQGGDGFDTFSYPDLADYRETSRTLAGVAGSWSTAVHLSTGRETERVDAAVVSGNYFDVLGVRPALGRGYLPEEDEAAAGVRAVVLGYGLWQRWFGGERSVVGATVRLNGEPFTVVGVAPEGFTGTQIHSGVELFAPVSSLDGLSPESTLRQSRDAVWLMLFGRLAPGVGVEEAQRELTGIAQRLEREYPESNEERGIQVVAGVGVHPGIAEAARGFLAILFGVVVVVLLVACANVANLLLARAVERRRELAVRAAHGASRGRLLRQLLMESLLLAAMGGVAAVALAMVAARTLVRLPMLSELPVLQRVPLDWRVLAFAAAVAVISGLVFGLAPALRMSRPDLVSSLKEGTPGSGSTRARARTALLVGQVALSMVALVAAGLFVRTLQNLYGVDSGFDIASVAVASVDVGRQGYDDERGGRFFDELIRNVEALPGVEAAGLGTILPLGHGGWDTRMFADDRPIGPEDEGIKTDQNAVSPGYFRAMGVTLVRGRGISEADRADAPRVVVINQALTDLLWPGEDPIGERLRAGREGEPVEVVGLVADAKYRSLNEESRPFAYYPFQQMYSPSATLHVRASGDPRGVLPLVQAEVRALDADLPIYRAGTLAHWRDRSLGPQRAAASLVGFFGALAFLLAAIGLYGSMSYTVSQRTREIGIRMALGARVAQVAGLVLRDAAAVLVVGIVIGGLAALAVTRLLQGQLFGVQPTDPLTFAAVAAMLLVVGLAASQLPARRASRVDPVTALRSE